MKKEIINQDKIIEKTLNIWKENPYIMMFGIEPVVVEPRFLKARFKVNDSLLNPYKTVHGGCLYSVADIVAGTLADFSGRYCTTVEGNMNYLERADRTEYIYCEAKMVRSGSHLIVVKVKIRNDKERIIDDGSFTFYKTDVEVLGEND